MSDYTTTSFWYIYRDPAGTFNFKNAGKQIAYIRCEGYTTEADRFSFFEHLVELLKTYGELSVSGKIHRHVNRNNLCAMLFYCDEHEQEILKQTLKNIKPLLNTQYQVWFEKCPDAKILTWNWRWKSDAKTLAEIKAKTHWTYDVGVRKK